MLSASCVALVTSHSKVKVHDLFAVTLYSGGLIGTALLKSEIHKIIYHLITVADPGIPNGGGDNYLIMEKNFYYFRLSVCLSVCICRQAGGGHSTEMRSLIETY